MLLWLYPQLFRGGNLNFWPLKGDGAILNINAGGAVPVHPRRALRKRKVASFDILYGGVRNLHRRVYGDVFPLAATKSAFFPISFANCYIVKIKRADR